METKRERIEPPKGHKRYRAPVMTRVNSPTTRVAAGRSLRADNNQRSKKTAEVRTPLSPRQSPKAKGSRRS